MVKYTQRQRVLSQKVPMDLVKLIESYISIHHLKKWTRNLMKRPLIAIIYSPNCENSNMDYLRLNQEQVNLQIRWSGDYDFPSIRECIYHCNEFMIFKNKRPRIHYTMISSHG